MIQTQLKTQLIQPWRQRLLMAVIIVSALATATVHAADSWDLPEAFPSQVEHGLQLMRDPQLQLAMQAYNLAAASDPRAYLLILHGKEETQKALAMQLSDWLVILGMQQENIRFERSRKLKSQLRLEIDTP